MKFCTLFLPKILIIFNIFNPAFTQDKPPLSKSESNRGANDKCQPGCANKMDQSCNKFDIELRAIITKCETMASRFKPSTPRSTDECSTNQMKCGKKLHATLKITSQGETLVDNQYIIIDHVTDTATGLRVSLLNPYVVILKQRPVMQLYGMKHQNVVNAEAKEQVINKRDPSFSGCDDVSDNPTCGNIRYNGDVVPYSQGFCCSCDEKKNFRRQPRTISSNNTGVNFQELIYNHFNAKREKRAGEMKDFNDYRSSIRFKGRNSIIYVTPKIIPKNKISSKFDIFLKPSNLDPINSSPESLNRQSRNENKVSVQPRGGQTCDESWPPKPPPLKNSYQDSAHCLRFSNLWYAMYQLSDPVMEHQIYIKIFQKREIDNGNTEWADLTGGQTVSVGSLNPKYEDQNIIVTYETSLQKGDEEFSIDSRQKRLLVPQDYPKGFNTPLECQGGPSEYLVVDKNDVQTSGDQCDVAGVGYTAFYNQPQRCSVSKGSCLHNQPSQLWRRDKKACRDGKRGKYFLKNYARVPDDALRRTKKSDSQYLALHYTNNYKSAINFDIKADDNIVFHGEPLAKITEVYIDSTSATSTILTIKIHNNGLTSNVFRPRLTDCPLELPVDWGTLEGDPVVIPPQHNSIFTLRLLGILPVKNFFCSVEVLTPRNEIVALRRIRVKKGDRCICSWHCLCACYQTTGLGCVLMSMEHYKAAGFIGSMPLTTNMVQVSYFNSAIFGFFFFVMLLIIILLIMGLTKALIGYFFFVTVGIWGLDMIIGLRPLCGYFEEELQGRQVLYDEDGWPLHPDTGLRTVRIVEERIEFFLNIIFFFTYPVMLLVILLKKCLCPFYTYYGDEDKDALFKGVNTVSYTKYPGSKQSSETECNADMFEFENFELCEN